MNKWLLMVVLVLMVLVSAVGFRSFTANQQKQVATGSLPMPPTPYLVATGSLPMPPTPYSH